MRLHRYKLPVLVAVLAVVATACGSSGGGGGAQECTSDFTVGVAYDVGGLGDKSFNDAAKAGLDKAIADAKQSASGPALLGAAMDQIAVSFGIEILKIVPNRVSTEVDARLSFDGASTLAKARSVIAMYEQAGIARERILIKIADDRVRDVIRDPDNAFVKINHLQQHLF